MHQWKPTQLATVGCFVVLLFLLSAYYARLSATVTSVEQLVAYIKLTKESMTVANTTDADLERHKDGMDIRFIPDPSKQITVARNLCSKNGFGSAVCQLATKDMNFTELTYVARTDEVWSGTFGHEHYHEVSAEEGKRNAVFGKFFWCNFFQNRTKTETLIQWKRVYLHVLGLQ